MAAVRRAACVAAVRGARGGGGGIRIAAAAAAGITGAGAGSSAESAATHAGRAAAGGELGGCAVGGLRAGPAVGEEWGEKHNSVEAVELQRPGDACGGIAATRAEWRRSAGAADAVWRRLLRAGPMVTVGEYVRVGVVGVLSAVVSAAVLCGAAGGAGTAVCRLQRGMDSALQAGHGAMCCKRLVAREKHSKAAGTTEGVRRVAAGVVTRCSTKCVSASYWSCVF